MSKWGKLFGGLKAGAQLGSILGIPGAGALIQAIHITEAIPKLKGADKKEAAKAIAENLMGDDGLLSSDQELKAIVDRFIDDYVAMMNRIEVLKHA